MVRCIDSETFEAPRNPITSISISILIKNRATAVNKSKSDYFTDELTFMTLFGNVLEVIWLIIIGTMVAKNNEDSIRERIFLVGLMCCDAGTINQIFNVVNLNTLSIFKMITIENDIYLQIIILYIYESYKEGLKCFFSARIE